MPAVVVFHGPTPEWWAFEVFARLSDLRNPAFIRSVPPRDGVLARLTTALSELRNPVVRFPRNGVLERLTTLIHTTLPSGALFLALY